MIGLLQNVVEIRGERFTVTELSAGVMRSVRALIQENKAHDAPPLIVQHCCIDPKFDAKKVSELPSYIVTKLADEAYRLTALASEGDDEKND